MSRAKVGLLFLAASTMIASFAYVGSVRAQDWGCSGATESTCPNSDIGCHADNPHGWCQWSSGIAHCNCTLVPPIE